MQTAERRLAAASPGLLSLCPLFRSLSSSSSFSRFDVVCVVNAEGAAAAGELCILCAVKPKSATFLPCGCVSFFCFSSFISLHFVASRCIAFRSHSHLCVFVVCYRYSHREACLECAREYQRDARPCPICRSDIARVEPSLSPVAAGAAAAGGAGVGLGLGSPAHATVSAASSI